MYIKNTENVVHTMVHGFFPVSEVTPIRLFRHWMFLLERIQFLLQKTWIGRDAKLLKWDVLVIEITI